MKDLDWNKLNAQRRLWKPNDPEENTQDCVAPSTINRCLALTPLESAVKDFILAGSSPLPEHMKDTLLRNSEDEENHLVALTNARKAFKKSSDEWYVEAKEIMDQWNALPDNPITKAAVLECGVFFVILPLYSLFGTTALRISSNSISGDERLHVQSHRAASMFLKAKPSKALNALRKDTVAWFSSDIDREIGGNWSKERCLKNSESLMLHGISDMIETAVGTTIAPYEMNNRNMERYA